MRIIKGIVAALTATSLCASAQVSLAQAPPAEPWRTIGERDSAAALTLIETSHPGVAAELGDHAFQARLATSRAHVAERLPRVTDYPAYAALMEGLAADFDDGHIRSSAVVGAQRIDSAGLILVRQGGRWMVGAQDSLPGEEDLTRATFLGCDGADADAWADPRIRAFRGDPVVEAVRAKAAGWLLLDYRNPFLARPASCRFAREGERPHDVALRWRPAFAPPLRGSLQVTARPGAAGMKVEPFAGGWWIGLQTLDETAGEVVKAVEEHRVALRTAPLVVVDLRGNGGGNSAFSDAIARTLIGDARFAAAQVRLARCSGAFWRASPGNMTALRDAAKGSTDRAAEYAELADDMAKALAAGRSFSPALPPCARGTGLVARETTRPLPPSAMSGRLVLVTDRACFSSCLLATALFRRLGALHVGEATDRSTRYMEVREEMLPSGLRTFSTLQKVAVGLGDVGPFTPAIVYPGALGDKAALRSWIVAEATRTR